MLITKTSQAMGLSLVIYWPPAINGPASGGGGGQEDDDIPPSSMNTNLYGAPFTAPPPQVFRPPLYETFKTGVN